MSRSVRLMRLASTSPAGLAWFFGGVLLVFFLWLIVGVGRVETAAPDHGTVAVCIEKYKAQTAVTNVNVGALYDLNRFCYDSIGSQLNLDQEKIRRDSFVFQRNENIVLLYMVVLVTISGVVLAGVQLLASYKLALIGRGELAGGGSEIGYSTHNVSFKSSVIGLTILAMSFAFFLVFIVYVYDMQEISSERGPLRSARPAQQLPTNLIPVLPPADPPRAPPAPSSATASPTAEQR
jgi:hypothetical protein